MTNLTKMRIRTVLNYVIGVAALIFAAYILLK